uniref:Uncharacterized protein n=1 Tax=viral metagenome TaxID=1070528 RepID=A0A6C0LDG5_9ZZZZ
MEKANAKEKVGGSNNKNAYLLFMIFCYLVPISIVYFYYDSHHSISSIICSYKHKYIILFFMCLMGFGTILYELERRDKFSTILITMLLFCLYGLICINEKSILHFIFSFLTFAFIISFMIRHYILTKYNTVLLISLLVEILVALYSVIQLQKNIFFSEVLLLANFAFYFIYLHFLQ